MPLTSIIVRPEWYEDLKWGLEEIKSSSRRKNLRSLASTSLRTLEMGKKKFDEGKWDQLVFTTKEAKFLTEISEIMGLEDAVKRFGAKPVRS